MTKRIRASSIVKSGNNLFFGARLQGHWLGQCIGGFRWLLVQTFFRAAGNTFHPLLITVNDPLYFVHLPTFRTGCPGNKLTFHNLSPLNGKHPMPDTLPSGIGRLASSVLSINTAMTQQWFHAGLAATECLEQFHGFAAAAFGENFRTERTTGFFVELPLFFKAGVGICR